MSIIKASFINSLSKKSETLMTVSLAGSGEVKNSSSLSFMTDKLFAKNMFLLSIWIFSIPFIYHAFLIGFDFASDGQSEAGVFTTQNPRAALYLIAWHMMLGATMNFLAPFQVHLGLTRKNKSWHRWVGVTTLAIGFFGATVGSLYFSLYQDVNFGTQNHAEFPVYQAGGMYGVVMFYILFKCVQSLVQKRYVAHKEWAIRFMIVAVGSWLARIITGWWVMLFVGAASMDSTIAVDESFIQISSSWGFYLLPLAIYEIYLRLKRSGKTRSLPVYTPFLTSLVGVFVLGVGTVGYLVKMYYL